MRQLTLREFEKTPEPLRLSREERDALAEVAPSVTITPAGGTDGEYHLTPGSLIGAIHLQTLAIEIRPKVSIDRVLFLISYALAPHRWLDFGFNFGEADSLVEAIIPGFVARVRRAFRRGLLQGYRSEEDTLTTVRGRIRLDDQIRDRFGIYPPLEVRYDDFTEDVTENRLIKAAIECLGRRRIRSDSARRSLRSFDQLLSNVSLTYFEPRSIPDISYSRLNEHYRPVIELACLILRSAAIELRHGRYHASSFLVDMNQVFEDFVVVAIRECLRLTPRQFPQNARGRSLHLDEASRVALEPDVSWWEGDECVFVGDAKYKRINVAGVKHPDLYQLLAYTVAADLPSGLLIYAAGEAEPVSHDVRLAGKRLEVVALDCSGTPDQILGQVALLAERIRKHRARARRQS